jgi:hypothetical protein
MKRRILSLLLLFALLIGSLSFARPSMAATTTQKHLKVNNTILDFNEIIYVDCTNGDDTAGDGSKSKPFKTVVKGFDYLSDNCRVGSAIVMKDGTYDVRGLFNGKFDNLSDKYSGMKISLLAETMGKVQFSNMKEWMIIENSTQSRIKISMYGIVFKSVALSWYWLGGDDWVNEYYNCVFIGGYGCWNKLVPSASIKVENSLFTGNQGSTANDYPATGSAINCASTTKNMEPIKGTFTNSLYNVTIDSDYNITNTGWKNTGIGSNPDGTVANIGVYGGQFSWGSTVREIPTPTIPTDEGNKAILEVVMTNGTIKEYDLTATELERYLTWYDNRSDGIGKPYFKMPKRSNVKPFISRNEYLSYDKIYSFEVKDYNE